MLSELERVREEGLAQEQRLREQARRGILNMVQTAEAKLQAGFQPTDVPTQQMALGLGRNTTSDALLPKVNWEDHVAAEVRTPRTSRISVTTATGAQMRGDGEARTTQVTFRTAHSQSSSQPAKLLVVGCPCYPFRAPRCCSDRWGVGAH